MYAFYENCDPYVQGDLEKIDQMIPHLVVKIFQGIPGMAGLFVAATYCGTLRCVSLFIKFGGKSEGESTEFSRLQSQNFIIKKNISTIDDKGSCVSSIHQDMFFLARSHQELTRCQLSFCTIL